MPELPDWQPLDGAAPPELPGGPAGRVVAVVATEGAAEAGWAAGAALELAQGWASAGARVILVDGVLNRPALHEAAGLPNLEGLTDAVLHGGSLRRVARPVGEDDFFLVSAGTPVADAGEVVRHARWYRITAAMAEADVTLGVYLIDGESATAAFLGSASDIVVLAALGDEPPRAIRDLEPLVRAVVGKGGAGAAMQAGSQVAPAVPEGGGPGVSRMILFVVLAIVVAAALGYLLVVGTG
jgi:hypothetical protein